MNNYDQRNFINYTCPVQSLLVSLQELIYAVQSDHIDFSNQILIFYS
jgi:hypothetical protein